MTKALILLAGSGRRLLPLTETTPKPLVDVAGRPLVARSIDTLVACGVTSIVGVVGYGADEIEHYFAVEYPGLDLELIYNDRYDDTNNAYSLLCARAAFAESGMILLDGDIMYERAIMESVAEYETHGAALVVRRSNDLGAEEMKVMLDRRGNIRYVGKHLGPAESIGESIGIARFDAAATSRLFDTLEMRISRQGKTGEFYEASFQQMIDEGATFGMIDAGDSLCIEIDTLDDLRTAAREVAPWIDRGELIMNNEQ